MPDQLEELLDRAGIGTAQIDPNGRFLRASRRYCEMLGSSPDDVLQSELQNFVHPDDLPETLDGFIRAFETGNTKVVDHRVLRRNGPAFWMSNTISPVGTPQGAFQYVVVLAQDVTDLKEAERALARSRADLRAIIDSAAEGIYCIDRRGTITLCNAAFLRMLNFEREHDVVGKAVHHVIHQSRTDGVPYAEADLPVYKTAQSGIHIHLLDEIYLRRDGARIPIECWVRPIVRHGEIEGAICTFVDITERKQAEARQQLLTQEMAHRVKNTLAMVQAIVGQSLRNSPATNNVVQTISHRLVALGNAHTILTRTRWGNASIVEVVESAINIHRSDSARIKTIGPKFDLGARASLALTMALHELCTNAAKYGALSNESGTVAIEWSVLGGAADARFQLSWKERGGPPVAPPTRQGFGSRLIAESVGPDLGGEAALTFDPSGVVWTLSAPLSAVKE